MTNNIKNKGEIIIYQTKQGPKLEVKMEKQTVWLTQAQIGLLFDTERSVITKHVKNVFDSGELKEKLAGQEQEILNLLAYYSSSLEILEKYDKNS